MYRHGLGDCFLLAFPKPDGTDFYILIDCGVILGTPNADQLISAVVADLAETTGKHIDVLVATHEHWDHLSGFDIGKNRFKDFQFDNVWLAWTEDPANATAQKLRRERGEKLAALWLGFHELTNRLQGLTPPGATGLPLGNGAGGPESNGNERIAVLSRAAQVLSFFGVDATDEPPQVGGFGAAAAAAVSKTRAALDWVRTVTKNPKFWSPGDTFVLNEANGVRVYVLGPPTDMTQLLKDLPTRGGKETYDALKAAPAAVERAFFGIGDDLQIGSDTSLPFDKKYRIAPEDAQGTDFFRDHYYGSGPDDQDAWRRIDGDWTGGAAELALQLDSDTNNTSLALAFELPDGRVLLFPGDAQVGNWESWHADSGGTKLVWKVGDRDVVAEQLLNRTVLYKAGHHGSHNATLREKGLEMMTDENLAAIVPVDVFVAHDKKGWTKMPFDPLISRLVEVTRGRIVQADQALAVNDGAKPGEPSGWAKNPTAFPSALSDSEKQIEVVVDGKGNTSKRPLYVEYVL